MDMSSATTRHWNSGTTIQGASSVSSGVVRSNHSVSLNWRRVTIDLTLLLSVGLLPMGVDAPILHDGDCRYVGAAPTPCTPHQLQDQETLFAATSRPQSTYAALRPRSQASVQTHSSATALTAMPRGTEPAC